MILVTSFEGLSAALSVVFEFQSIVKEGRMAQELKERTKKGWYRFSQLSVEMLYQVLRLREQVFMLEQQSLYEDLDNQDQHAEHLLATEQGQLVGYLRLLAADEDSVKLGRIVLAPSARGSGLGEQLIAAGIERARDLNPSGVIKISAQLDLQHYYEHFGFTANSCPYDDGGILHIDMIKSLSIGN